MDRSALGHLRASGKRIPPAESTMNAILDALVDRNTPMMRGGRSDSFGESSRKLTNLRHRWVQVTPDSDFPSYSIIDLDTSILNAENKLEITAKAPTIHTLMWGANEEYPLYANVPGWVRIITSSDYVVVRAVEALYFLDRCQYDAGGAVKFAYLSDLICCGGSRADGDFFMTPVRLDPVQSWLGVSRSQGLMGTAGDVEVGSTGEKRNVAFPFGDFDENHLVWVSRGLGIEESGPGSRWVGVQRPCPEN